MFPGAEFSHVVRDALLIAMPFVGCGMLSASGYPVERIADVTRRMLAIATGLVSSACSNRSSAPTAFGSSGR